MTAHCDSDPVDRYTQPRCDPGAAAAGGVERRPPFTTGQPLWVFSGAESCAVILAGTAYCQPAAVVKLVVAGTARQAVAWRGIDRRAQPAAVVGWRVPDGAAAFKVVSPAAPVDAIVS